MCLQVIFHFSLFKCWFKYFIFAQSFSCLSILVRASKKNPFNFEEVQFIIFFMVLPFIFYLKILCLTLGYKTFFLCFLLSFVILLFTFRIMIHLELIFIW